MSELIDCAGGKLAYIIAWSVVVVVFLCGWKSIVRFRFPWERCPCCGQKHE